MDRVRNKHRATLAGGVMSLTAAALVVKVIGLVFKIPLTNMIGEAGMGYFNSAYTVYTFFYTVSTAGLPIALSILISSALAKSREDESEKLFKAAKRIFAISGLLLSSFMMIFSGMLANAVSNSECRLAIAAMSPTVLFVCLAGAYRGYFQGRGQMHQTAISQVIESLGKCVFGLFLPAYAVKVGASTQISAALAMSGITIGHFISLLYLFMAYNKDKHKNRIKKYKLSFRESMLRASTVLKTALPISLGSAIVSLSGIIDLSVVMKCLQDIGYSESASNALFGAYTGMAVPIFNIPAMLITPIASAIVPYVSYTLSRGDYEGASEKAKSCLKYAITIAFPASLGMCVCAERIIALLFGNGISSNVTVYLQILSAGVLFVCLTNVCVALLQASGHRVAPVVIMAIGSLVKIAISYPAIKYMGMSGTPISTVVSYFVMSLLCLILLKKLTGISLSVGKLSCLPMASAVLCAMSAHYFSEFFGISLGRLALLPALALAAAVYFALILISGYIKTEEILNLIRGKNGKQGKNQRAYRKKEIRYSRPA